MRLEWAIDMWNGVKLNQKKRTVIISSGDNRAGGATEVSFDKFLEGEPPDLDLMRFPEEKYRQVCDTIKEINHLYETKTLDHNANCWLEIARTN